MSSPFSGFNNAILKIPDGKGQLIINPDTGNYEQQNTFIDYQAILMVQKSRGFETGDFQRTEGIDSTWQLVRGYLVNPMFFPTDFTLPATVDCSFINTDSRVTRGTLELEIMLDPFKVGAIAGQQLQGIFRILGVGNEGNNQA
jgi:hypothetical protein